MNATLFFFYLSICLSYVVIRPVATLIHECGHWAYLRWIVREPVITVYIGSLGAHKRAWILRTGRTTWVIHPSALLMRGSLCDYPNALENRQMVPFALAGPMSSLVFSGICTGFALSEWTSGPMIGLKAVLVLAALISIVDVLLALLRKTDNISLTAMTLTAGDGQVIGWRWKYGRHTKDYLHASWLFEKERYAEAAAIFEAVEQGGCTEKDLYEHLIFCRLMAGEPEKALADHARLAERHPLEPYDQCHLAIALDWLGKTEDALTVLNTLLRTAPGHPEALNLRAALRVRAGAMQAAKQDLDQCLHGNPEFAAAYCNRAGVFLLAGDLAAAEKDLVRSLKLEHENPFIHRNWAHFHLAKLEFDLAKAAFERAKLLGLKPAEYGERLLELDQMHRTADLSESTNPMP